MQCVNVNQSAVKSTKQQKEQPKIANAKSKLTNDYIYPSALISMIIIFFGARIS